MVALNKEKLTLYQREAGDFVNLLAEGKTEQAEGNRWVQNVRSALSGEFSPLQLFDILREVVEAGTEVQRKFRAGEDCTVALEEQEKLEEGLVGVSRRIEIFRPLHLALASKFKQFVREEKRCCEKA